MARITIASLQLIVAQQDTALEALRTEVNHYMDVATRQDALIASLTVERDELLVAQRPSRRAPNTHVYTPRAPSAESLAFRAKCEAAKRAAMAGQTAVLVA